MAAETSKLGLSMSLNECEDTMRRTTDSLSALTECINSQGALLSQFLSENIAKLPDDLQIDINGQLSQLEELSELFSKQLSPLLLEGLNNKLMILRAYLHE
jgi:hypothetical protein